MKRASANECYALSALSSHTYVNILFECHMLGYKKYPGLPFSPDGVARIILTVIGVASCLTHAAAFVII